MKTTELKCAFISDIHLGHKRVRARRIINNLKKAFPDNAETAELDIIFFGGDVFDDLLSSNDDDSYEIDIWIASFLRMCKKHDIAVRVLEGTPSHDWKQSNRFVVINEGVAKIGADLIYVKDLTIRYEERFDMNFLFVPDEWDVDPTNTLSQVKDLLRERNLDQVDVAIMHGQFDYQLPPFVKAPKHDAAEYQKLVKYLISIGHVHIYSNYERIIAQGSFDRLSHGEESPKGHVRATLYPDGTYTANFVENTGAAKFITVNCIGLTLEETIHRIDQKVFGLEDESGVRVEAEDFNPIFQNMDALIQRYPAYSWSKLPREEKEEEKGETEEEETLYIPITITRDNIQEQLMTRVERVCDDPLVLQRANEILMRLR